MCGRDWSSDVCSSDLPFGLVSLFDTLFGIHTQMVTIYDIDGVRRVAELGDRKSVV